MNDEFPDNWTIETLGDLVCLTSESGIPLKDPSRPFIGMEDVESNTGRVLGTKSPLVYSSSSYIVHEGQVLYGRLRPYLNKVFMPTMDCYASREFIPIFPGERLNAKFLFFRLTSSNFVEFAVSLNTGDRPRVKWPQMAQYQLPLPPLAEQQRIVEILEEQFSRLDAALASIRTVREKAKAFRRSLLHAAFGNLEADGILLGEVARVIDCEHKTAPKTSETPFAYSLGTSSIRFGTIRFEKSKPISQTTYEEWTAREVPEEGDLILTREAPMGEVAIVPDSPLVALGQRTVLVHLDKETMSPKFVHLVLLSPRTEAWIESHSVGTTVPHLNVADVKRIPLGELPTLLEQERIVQTVETDLSRLDSAVAIANQLEARIASERRSLLHAAFSGTLTAQWRETNNG